MTPFSPVEPTLPLNQATNPAGWYKNGRVWSQPAGSDSAAIGILLWLGIVGPIVYTTYMYEMRPMQLFAINEFYPLVGLCLMGGILGAWTKKAA